MPDKIMLVPECHVDTALARVLLADHLTLINHQQGITKVAKSLQLQAGSGRSPRVVVGVVDEDKRFATNHYLLNFNQVVADRSEPTFRECCYRIYRHSTHRSHYLIVLAPACDRWVFEAAQSAALDLTNFGLPTTLSGFLGVTKKETARTSMPLRNLLYAIRRARPAAYQELAAFVLGLMDSDAKLL